MKTMFVIMLMLAGCGDEKLKKVEQLNEFRVLGITASAPEVAPGGSSNLRLLVSDVNGGGRTLTAQVEMCIDPGIALGAAVTCAHDSAVVSTTYTVDTVGDVDLGAANLYTGQSTQVLSVTVPTTILNGRSAREQFNGVAYIVIFRFSADGKTQTAFRRLIATNRAGLNANPTLSSILHLGQNISAKPQSGDELSLNISGAESYQLQNIDGSIETRTENFEAAWYTSSGEFNRSKTRAEDAVKYKSTPPSSTLVLFVLLRDERGGLAFRRETL